jgi:hypothetical protein
MNMNLFYLSTRQAELGNSHSQTGVWERDIRIAGSGTTSGLAFVGWVAVFSQPNFSC